MPRLAFVRLVVASVLLLCTRPLAAQTSTGRLTGTVRAAQADATLPYAVINLPALSIERFTDGSGRYSLGALRSGTWEVLVRRIGFTPWRGKVTIVADSTTTLDVRLEQLPQRLATVAVRDLARCRNPGPPDPESQQETSSLVSQLRENADRYRLLAVQYPFSYSQTRSLGELHDSTFSVQRVDTSIVQSITRVVYRPGNLVTRTTSKERGDEYTMAIPTLVELSDDAFIRVHCFGYGGTVKAGNETWVRVNMRAADKLRHPDVHGAFFLDSATSQLRRMDLDMSRPDLLPNPLQRVEAVHVVTSFRDIASGLSVIESVCAVNQLHTPPGADPLPAPAELQQLLAYRFETPPPDVLRARGFLAPPWIAGAKLKREVVWCEQ
jgi:Carboxypeptidase regulatory-like domain